VKIRLRGTEQDCREAAGLPASVLPIQSVSEPYPGRERSVPVRACIEAVPRGPVTTLIAVYNSEGCVGRCDARCYEAAEPGL